MNTRTIGIIIRREYLNRVKKKSFIILTFLAPVLFAAMCILPSVIMMGAKEEAKKVAVIDASGIVMPSLENTETVTYVDCPGADLETMKADLKEGDYDAVLSISELDTVNKTFTSDVFSIKPLGLDMTENISNQINSALQNYKISSYDIEGLEDIMKDVKSKVKLRSYTLNDAGEETISESGVFMGVSMVLGMIIYMFIAIFSGMVMSSVIEEKSSRVVEVLISSVKATELLFGKIISVALVAITQFMLWIGLTLAIIGVVSAVAGPELFGGADTEQIAQMSGMSADQMAAITEAASDSDGLATILSTVRTMPLGEIVICFIIYFVFGYMLYASLFAAIGSAGESENDTQQLQIPITIPLLIGFFIAIYAFKAPDSSIVFWGSMIPFTSPIVMLARLPFTVPLWEVILSIVLLVATFALCAWLASKIYKVGILMYGKKSTWKDLWKWLKQN